MGDKTGITWTDHTWNPWRGCTRISDGCKNCYMFREQLTYGNDPSKIIRSKTTLRDPYKWESGRVFVCSWSDFFHPDVPQEWREVSWQTMKENKQLTFQVLTKRPENITSMLPKDWGIGYDNVWMGVTIESAKYWGRFYNLVNVPAKLYFISYEPSIGELGEFHYPVKINWLIAGGESGPNGRLCMRNWIDNARVRCETWHIPFFFKQWGGNKKIDGVWGGDTLNGRQYHEFPSMSFRGDE